MRRDNDLRRVVVALVGAFVSFCLVAVLVYCWMVDVRVNGFLHGGPATLAAAMAGLFSGGLLAVAVLVTLLRWGSRRERRKLQ
jgi:hypothetical protein